MRAVLALLLLWPFALFAVDRTLSDCTIGSTPTALAPLDLDNCTISDGDDITGILTGLATTYGDVYVKAPSQSISVTFTDTVEFGPAGQGADEFKFFEDEAHTLEITHVPVTADAQMWLFTNLDAITIGGPGLRMTFRGTHPGLGQGKPCSGTKETCDYTTQYGLLRVHLSDNSNPALLDFRANIWNTWGQGVYVTGGANGSAGEATANRWQQMNVAGLYMSSGVVASSGVMDAWVDPDRTVVMDPWNRGSGWDGVLAGTRPDGIDVGCRDIDRDEPRSHPAIGFQYMRSVQGGFTMEYGQPGANIFVSKNIGTEAAPYLIRIKDYGFSGPESLTGNPSGVMIKSSVAGIMKNDPSPEYGNTSTFRWIRFQELPHDYGVGVHTGGITSGCAPDNETSNSGANIPPYVWMAEASRDGVSAQYVNAYHQIEMVNIGAWRDVASPHGLFRSACESPDSTPGPTDPDRCHHNTYYAGSDSVVPGVVPMLDYTTVTGPGRWHTVRSGAVVTAPGGVTVNPQHNTVTDTRVSNQIVIGNNSTATVVHNVDFTVNATARAVITIGAGADVTATDLCVPDGSTITGTGALTYEGASESLPFTIPNSTSNCTITENPRSGPVTGGGVN